MAPVISTLVGRSVPIVVAFPTLPALLAAVKRRQSPPAELAAAARLVGPEPYLYVGGSCDVTCGKGCVWSHTWQYNNLGLSGLSFGDANVASVIFVVEDIRPFKADGLARDEGDGAEETFLRAILALFPFARPINVNRCGSSVFSHKGGMVLYVVFSRLAPGPVRDLRKAALADGSYAPTDRDGRVRWTDAEENALVGLVATAGKRGGASGEFRFVVESATFDALLFPGEFEAAKARSEAADVPKTPFCFATPTSVGDLANREVYLTGFDFDTNLRYTKILAEAYATTVTTFNNNSTSLLIRADAATDNHKTKAAAASGIPVITLDDLRTILEASDPRTVTPSPTLEGPPVISVAPPAVVVRPVLKRPLPPTTLRAACALPESNKRRR